MNDIIFTVPGVPQGKGRPRVTRNGTFTPKKTRDYEKKVRDCYIAQGGQMFPDDTPLFASITAIFPIPSSLSKKRRALFNGKRYCKKPDADNVAKAILDALKAVGLPAVEVHISDVDSREAFRQISYAGKACVQTYKGLGFDGYVQAIRFLKQYLTEGRV